MTEEKVTLTIIKKLRKKNWKILSFDYPQSGTGIMIKPDLKEKNLGGFIPDIVSFRRKKVLFWENKDRFVYSDFLKIDEIKKSKSFISPIQRFLKGVDYQNIYFGVAITKRSTEIQKALPYLELVDFFVTTNYEEVDVVKKLTFNIFS